MLDIISNKEVYNIICKTLSIVNSKIIQHGQVAGYIFSKMLANENIFTQQEIADYTMLGVLHDLGIYKLDGKKDIYALENTAIWAHSIYGYLFLRYLSPLGEKSEIVLYHHLSFNQLVKLQTKYQKVVEFLTLADKMDNFMHSKDSHMEQNFFVKYRDIQFSGYALDAFFRAESKYHITENLKNGTYLSEISEILSKRQYTENEKHNFLKMLIYTIDFRSEHTVIHTLATTTFAQELGRLMRLNGSDMVMLYYGALLHDVGKIAIPIHILEAPRKLTDNEMRVMRAHVQITEIILRGIINDDVVDIAVRHHEKMDGSGYHRGLDGRLLTLPQRIIAVADIISALFGRRSYKESFEGDLIKKIISEDAANHKICQEVVDCALKNYDEIMQNFEKNRAETMGMYLTIKEQYEIIYKRFRHFE